MVEIVAYTPDTVISRAMFNYDAQGVDDFVVSGTIRVSVSDAFTKAQYDAAAGFLSRDVYTSAASGTAPWTQLRIDDINLILQSYMTFVPVSFTSVKDRTGATPADVGLSSDINISLITRPDLGFAGESALSTDFQFLYTGSRGDIVINTSRVEADPSFALTWYSGHVLMHEIGHELGLSHPHTGFIGTHAILSTDFLATAAAGFDQLGFVIRTGLDMNKEYFSVMSYDDQLTPDGNTFAQTPMILDVIALQTAYGEGPGSSGSGDDTITPGQGGQVSSYRTYNDRGGTDTIDLVNYATGAYLHMGAPIEGAQHLVGVAMSQADATRMAAGDSPYSLRWFYGEFENALGSDSADHIIGNQLDNVIRGRGGDDVMDGGAGRDTALYSGARRDYRISSDAQSVTVVDGVTGRDGTDVLTRVEDLRFTDGTVVLDVAFDAGAPVYAIYRIAFGRAPDEVGFRYWTSSGASAADLAQAFTSSIELRLSGAEESPETLLTALYQHTFGRTPDDGGYAYWAGVLRQGVSPDEVVGSFARSAEAMRLTAEANPVGFWVV